MKNKDKILIRTVISACLISALHIFFCFDIYDDIAAWYAPMVRAFTEADWDKAFVPAVPILSTSLAGILGYSGLGPFRALVIVSCLFYIASIPVLYYVLKYFLKREDYVAWMNISGNEIQFAEQLGQIKEADFVVLESKQKDIIKILKQQKEFRLLAQEHPKVLIFASSKGKRK